MIKPQTPSEPFNKIAFVGEAPRVNDMEQGKPMMGPAGRVFDGVLRSANVDRDQSLVTNVFNMQLLDDSLTAQSVAMGEKWKPFLNASIQRLTAEIEACRPYVIVPMGATALRAIVGSPAISSARGSLVQGAGPFSSYKVLPTWHPEDILKVWKTYAIAIGDVVKAAVEAEKGPTLEYPKVWIVIDPTMAEVKEYLDACYGKPLVSVDIETGWGMIRGISFSYDQGHAIYVPFIDLRQPSKSYWKQPEQEVQVWQWVKQLLEDPSVPKLGQNFTGYDIHWLLVKMGIRVMGFTHDTRLLHHALYAELPKSLAFMASAYSALPGWKHWSKQGGAKKYQSDKRDQ